MKLTPLLQRLLLQQLLLLCAAVVVAAVAAAPLFVSRPGCRGCLVFLRAPKLPADPSHPCIQRPPPLFEHQGGPLHAAGAPVAEKTSKEGAAPRLTFLEWGRGPPPPLSPEALIQQQQQQQQQQESSSVDGGGVCGLLCCTSWDPRSKALVAALGMLHREAFKGAPVVGGVPPAAGGEGEGPSHLPLYPVLGVRVTNSLVIARGRRALFKQRRMACNMKQLRHNERALNFMLQQQPPLQLHKLPALQLYAQQQQQVSLPLQLVEIRAVSPRALQRLGADESALCEAWGPQGPPGGPPQVGALGAWLRRLGCMYEGELRRLVEERLRQAEEEYPIYREYNPDLSLSRYSPHGAAQSSSKLRF
ncbi:hypothetical protein Esti_001736 [Eimeria stiedai]